MTKAIRTVLPMKRWLIETVTNDESSFSCWLQITIPGQPMAEKQQPFQRDSNLTEYEDIFKNRKWEP